MLNWLVSYPKSGNTWVRIFLSAYIQDAKPDINKLTGTVSDQLPAAHHIGYNLNMKDIDPEHSLLTRSMALLRIAYTYQNQDKHKILGEDWPLILKTHVANAVIHGMRLIPPTLTEKIVLIVRDPRDIVLSYAKHFGFTLDEAIDAMMNDQLVLSDKSNRDKAPHHTTSWRNSVALYATSPDLDVTVVRYEQLKEDPARYFSWILKWYGIPVDKARVKRAVGACKLSKMRKQEDDKGFLEASDKAERFFGKGKTGGWKDVLTPEQVERLEAHGEDMMKIFGYLEDNQLKAVA